VSVFDTNNNKWLADVDVGIGPYDIAISPSGKWAYVGNSDKTISVINTETLKEVVYVIMPDICDDLVVNYNGTYGYAFCRDQKVYVFNLSKITVDAAIDVQYGSSGLAINPSGTRLYATSYFFCMPINPCPGGNVVVIDTATNTVVDTIKVGMNPRSIVVNPSGTRAYVTNNYANTVSVIDTTNNTVVSTIVVGNNPLGITINALGTRVYVANSCDFCDGSVSVIDTATNTVMDTISNFNVLNDSGPCGVALNASGSRLYVTDGNSNVVYVIDTATNNKIDTLLVGQNPYGIATWN
jgi:YVTN family beta-propeller protein